MTSALAVENPAQKLFQTKPSNFRFRDNPPLPRLRRDLTITEHSYRNRVSYVIKDPVSLRYYRLGPLEYFVAQRLDGKRTLNDLLLEVEQAYGKNFLTQADLQRIINMFINMSLLELDSDRALQLAKWLQNQHQLLLRKTSLIRHLGKITSFKITLLDPDILLLKLNRYTNFLWTKTALFVLLALIATTLITLALNWDNALSKTPDFFSLQNLIYVWLLAIVVKIFHEFGHGLSCKNFGGEVHEMGFMFIVFTPYLFCNATDSWLLKEKWKRITVTLAGIYIELFIACFAALLWIWTEPGLLNQLAFNVMIICSISTIFMNFNPLMKFDGYYALADFLEIPNLRERADRFFFTRVSEFLTNHRLATHDPIAEPLRIRLSFYSIACYLWLISVTFGILYIIDLKFRDFGLHRLLQLGAGITLLYSLTLPFLGIFKTVRQSLKAGAKLPTFLLRLALLLLAILALLSIPLPFHFTTSCIISSSHAIPLTTNSDAFLRSLHAQPNEHVQAGQLLAQLSNPALDNYIQELTDNLRYLQLQQNIATARNDETQLASTRLQAEQLQAQLREALQRRQSLEIRAPAAGTLLSLPKPHQLGTLFPAGTRVALLLPDGPPVVAVPLTDLAASAVRPGDPATFRLTSDPATLFRGKVHTVSPVGETLLPHEALGQGAGGSVPIQAEQALTPDGRIAHRTLHPYFEARVGIDSPSSFLRPGMSGRIKISAGWRSLGWRLQYWFLNKLRKDYQL